MVVEGKQKKETNWESLDQKWMALHCCRAGLKQILIFGFDYSAAKNEETQWTEPPHSVLAEGLGGADWLP